MTTPAARDWPGDLLCFLLAIGSTVLALFEGLEHHVAPALLAVDLALGGLSCLGVWVRRRRPVGFAVVVGLFSVYSTAAAGVALIALFTVAVHRRLGVVGPVVAGYALIPFASLLVRPDLPVAGWTELVLGVAFFAAVLASGMFVRARRESLRDQARRAESEQRLQEAQARQLERNRIAREMHDVLAHRLSLLSLHAGALEVRPEASPQEVARAAGVIRDSAYHALEDLREVIGVLRADANMDETPERPQPTLVDLPDLVDQCRRAGMRVRFECRVAEPATAPEVIGRSAYRIVQEGLTNARKHARDTKVTVSVHGSAVDGLTLEMSNPCPTVDADLPGAGAGLIGLTERATLAGGRLAHGRTPTGDFRLEAWLPWPT